MKLLFVVLLFSVAAGATEKGDKVQERWLLIKDCARDEKDSCEKLNETEKKVAQGYKKLDEEFLKKSEEWKKTHEKEGEKNSPAYLEYLNSLDVIKFKKEKALYEEHCPNPEAHDFCPDDEAKNLRELYFQSRLCFRRRFALIQTSSKKDDSSLQKKILSEHMDIDKIRKGINCEELLEKDRAALGLGDSEKEAPAVTVAPSPEEDKGPSDEENPRNYKHSTCDWVRDLPRRIINGPGEKGCDKKSNARFCVGYVVCDRKEGGGKFMRLSSCGPENCGDSKKDAIKCTWQQNHFSFAPKDEDKTVPTSKVKKGAVKQ